MAAIRTIIAGPSQWDLMLSLFEDKEVTFTFRGNDKVKGVVETLSDWRWGDRIVWPEHLDRPTREDHLDADDPLPFRPWLIALNPPRDEPSYDESGLNSMLFAEYSTEGRRRGHGAVLSGKELDGMSKTVFMYNVWKQVLGIPL